MSKVDPRPRFRSNAEAVEFAEETKRKSFTLEDTLDHGGNTKRGWNHLESVGARFLSWKISLLVSGRNLPVGTSRTMGPSWTRLIFSTLKPT